MGITGKQISNGVAILKLALEAKGLQLTVGNVVAYAAASARIVSTDNTQTDAIERSIVERLVTITVEAK